MRRALRLAIVLLASATLTPRVVGQSLAGVAADEAKRRATTEKPSKTFTNADLPAAASNATPLKAADDAGSGAAPSSAEVEWREKMRPVREKYAADQIAERAAWSLVESMQATGVNRTAPAEWLKALAEHGRLANVVREDMRAFMKVFDEAAAAGVALEPYDGPVRQPAPSPEASRDRRYAQQAELRKMRETLAEAESTQRDAQHQVNVCSGSQGYVAVSRCARQRDRLADLDASILRLRTAIARLEQEVR